MSSVVFSHTKMQEKEYLHKLLEERDWFERENFPAFLPKNKDEIKNEIRRKNESLNKRITWLKKKWKEVEKDYFQIANKFKHKKILSSYKCHVSCFGPEGQYCCPNLLYIRLRTKSDKKRAIETIGHELLHLLFADFFENKKFNYSEREGMVDALILQSDLINIFSSYQKQSIGKLRQKIIKIYFGINRYAKKRV